jgi:hypothetical protein
MRAPIRYQIDFQIDRPPTASPLPLLPKISAGPAGTFQKTLNDCRCSSKRGWRQALVRGEGGCPFLFVVRRSGIAPPPHGHPFYRAPIGSDPSTTGHGAGMVRSTLLTRRRSCHATMCATARRCGDRRAALRVCWRQRCQWAVRGRFGQAAQSHRNSSRPESELQHCRDR